VKKQEPSLNIKIKDYCRLLSDISNKCLITGEESSRMFKANSEVYGRVRLMADSDTQKKIPPYPIPFVVNIEFFEEFINSDTVFDGVKSLPWWRFW